jgi:hypothetical protein
MVGNFSVNNNNNKNEADDDFKVKVRVGGKTRGARVDEFAAAARKSEHSFPPWKKNDPLKRKKKIDVRKQAPTI